jgi:hypothetical protein
MNDVVYRIICAESFDENDTPINVLFSLYCHTEDDADKIVEFMSDTMKPNGVWILERCNVVSFEDVFNSLMKNRFGNGFNDKMVN